MVAAGVPGAAFSRDPRAVAFGRVERLTDRVWLVVERDDDAPVFLYVVVGASRVLLVDSGAGGEPYGDWLDGFLMGAAGLDAAARPRTCVNLDGGLRHVGGNGSLGAATTIAASGRDRAFTAGARAAARREARRRGRRDLEPYDVGAWLDDGASLDLGGGDAVRVVQTPGHAPDALCLWYARDAMLFAGDLVRPPAVFFSYISISISLSLSLDSLSLYIYIYRLYRYTCVYIYIYIYVYILYTLFRILYKFMCSTYCD